MFSVFRFQSNPIQSNLEQYLFFPSNRITSYFNLANISTSAYGFLSVCSQRPRNTLRKSNRAVQLHHNLGYRIYSGGVLLSICSNQRGWNASRRLCIVARIIEAERSVAVASLYPFRPSDWQQFFYCTPPVVRMLTTNLNSINQTSGICFLSIVS